MNIERLKKVRAFIKKLPAKACNMRYWQMIEKGEEFTFRKMEKRGFACGSAACIGGWTELIANQMTEGAAQESGVGYITAREYLELSFKEADVLFEEYPDDIPDGRWQAWILERLAGVIKDEKIRPWTKQMEKKR